VVTGEGRVDATTLDGKVVMGIGRMASKYGKKVLVLAGSVGAGAEGLLENGISKLVQVSPPGMPLREAISRAEELLELASRDTATKFTQT